MTVRHVDYVTVLPRRLQSPAIFFLFNAVVPRAHAANLTFENDPAEYYGSRFFLAMLFLGAALIVYSLVRYRGRLQNSTAWLFLIERTRKPRRSLM